MTTEVQANVAVGSVHGRFQPLHNGHMEYILAAKARCDYLWVGITQYVRSHLVDVDGAGSHRSVSKSNPLTYHERYLLLTEALLDVGVPSSEFGITPFPIEAPELLSEFLPTDVLMYTTICEEWNKIKILTLRKAGYVVDVLWEREKTVSGQQVRELILRRDNVIVDLVPPATLRIIEGLELWDRL